MATTQSATSDKTKGSSAKSTPNAKADELEASIEQQLATIRDDIAKLTTTLTDLGRAQGAAARDQVTATAAELRARGEQNVRYAQDQVTAAAQRAEASVRENPGAAVGIAAGIGFIIGMLMSSRR